MYIKKKSHNLARLSAVIGLIVLVVFCLHHIFFEKVFPESFLSEGAANSLQVESNVLVVVWSDEILRTAQENSFEGTDWSWMWVESLQAELGPVQICEPEGLDSSIHDSVQVVVLTHSALVHPWLRDNVEQVAALTRRGVTVVIERPEGEIRDTFSGDGLGGVRRPEQISFVRGVSPDVAVALEEMPLFTMTVGSSEPLIGTDTFLEMDGLPVVYRLLHNSGYVITVDFDYGLAVMSLQQGRPLAGGFHVEDRDLNGLLTVADLVASNDLFNAEVPYADLLEHYLVQGVIGESVPLLGYWFFPGGTDGLLMLTHNVTSNYEQSSWMSRYERERSVESTFFIGSGGENYFSSFSIDPGEGLEAPYWGLLWSLSEEGYWDRVAALRDGEQLVLGDGVLGQTSENDPFVGANSGVRIVEGRWSQSYVDPFRQMVFNGLQYDSSYGTSTQLPGVRDLAYLHGTGRLFNVLDTNGLPFKLHEIPALLNELESPLQLEKLDLFLRRSQRSHHQAFAIQISSDMFEKEDALNRFEAWGRAIEIADNRNHNAISLQSYVQFYHDRVTSGLTLVEPGALVQQRGERDVVMEVMGSAVSEGFWVRTPAAYEGRQFSEARIFTGEEVEAQEAPAVRQIQTFGRPEHLVEVSGKGNFRLELIYR